MSDEGGSERAGSHHSDTPGGETPDDDPADGGPPPRGEQHVRRPKPVEATVRGKVGQLTNSLANPSDRSLAWMAALTVLCLICLSGRFEISRLVGDVVFGGERYSANVLSSMFDVGDVGKAVSAWNQAQAVIDVRYWLWWFLACEVLGLGALVVVLVMACHRWASGVSSKWLAVAGLWLGQLIVQALAVGGVSAAWLMVVLTILTFAAWVASIAFVGWFAFKVLSEQSNRKGLRIVVKALGVQRFQVGVVVLLAALFVVPGPPILEQGTDVVRSWVIDGEWASAVVGSFSFTLLAVVLRFLGSVRAAPKGKPVTAAQRFPNGELGWAIGGAGLVLVFFSASEVLDGQFRTDMRAVITAGAVLVAVPIAGYVTNRAL